MGDFDIGECWHNFLLHPWDQAMFGVKLPEELTKEWGDAWF